MRAKGKHYSPKEKADAALDACRDVFCKPFLHKVAK